MSASYENPKTDDLKILSQRKEWIFKTNKQVHFFNSLMHRFWTVIKLGSTA